jgi:hypothetical protein
MYMMNTSVNVCFGGVKDKVKVKQSLYTPWRCLGGEEI